MNALKVAKREREHLSRLAAALNTTVVALNAAGQADTIRKRASRAERLKTLRARQQAAA